MYKIYHGNGILVMLAGIFLYTSSPLMAQDTLANPYGLHILRTAAALQQTVAVSPGKAMVDLRQYIPGIAFDLRYAGRNNFMQQQLYPTLTTSFMRKTAADALRKVQAALRLRGLGLKIYDAYRPYAVTQKMWLLVQDERYAANPRNGSGHNRGTAVDLTLISLQTRKALPMGTAFDNFSDTAHHGFTALPEKVLQNRLLLKSLMEQYGFKALDTEWWHYSLPDARLYELLDISFADLQRMYKTGVRW